MSRNCRALKYSNLPKREIRHFEVLFDIEALPDRYSVGNSLELTNKFRSLTLPTVEHPLAGFAVVMNLATFIPAATGGEESGWRRNYSNPVLLPTLSGRDFQRKYKYCILARQENDFYPVLQLSLLLYIARS